MNTQEMQKTLQQYKNSDHLETRCAALRILPSRLRATGYHLLGLDAHGKPFATEQWQERQKVSKEAIAVLHQLSNQERQALFQALMPRLAQAVEEAWQWLECLPYTTRHQRRPFRAPNRPQLAHAHRTGWLLNLLHISAGYDEDVAWFAQWGGYLGYFADYSIGILCAASIDKNDEKGHDVFDILMDTARGQHPSARMGRHVILGLLCSKNSVGWEMVEKLLITAQHQERLRQMILDSVDHAHPNAFRRMVTLIVEQNLVRFSTVMRAINVWLGLQLEATASREAGQILEQLNYLLNQPEEDSIAMLSNDDPQAVYIALWVLAFHDAENAVRHTRSLLIGQQATHRFVAVHFLAQTHLSDCVELLFPRLVDDDLRVATRALQALSHSRHPDLFEHLEVAIAHFPLHKETLPPIVWPWMALSVERKDITRALPQARQNRPVSSLFPYLDQLETWQRRQVISAIVHERNPKGTQQAQRITEKQSAARVEAVWDRDARLVLFQLLGDRSADVRGSAIDAIAQLQISGAEAKQMEQYLRRKAGDLRRGVLRLLLNQTDAGTMASSMRLLTSRDRQMRLGGLELLRQMREKQRQVKQCIEMGTAHQHQCPSLSQEEKSLLDQILMAEQSVPTLADGLGLFDPTQRTPPTPPRRSMQPKLVTKAAGHCLASLDQLIHEHRHTMITYHTQQRNDEVQKPLGEAGFDFPRPKGTLSNAANEIRLPLRQLWETWWQGREHPLYDADGFELVRAFATVIHQTARPHALEQYWLKNECSHLFTPLLQKLRYPSLVRSILEWLIMLHPPPDGADFMLDAVEYSFWLSPEMVTDENKDREITRRAHIRIKDWRTERAFLGWLLVTWRIRELWGQAWKSQHHLRFWGLLRWKDEPLKRNQSRLWLWQENSRGVKSASSSVLPCKVRAPRDRAQLDEIMCAYHLKGATQADILDLLIGERVESTQYVGYYTEFQALSALSGRQPNTRYSKYAENLTLRALVARCRKRILEVELQRDELATAASKPALALRYAGGMETLFQLLQKRGNLTFTRGWNRDSLSKRAVFSHLIRATFPTEKETPGCFAMEIVPLKIERKQLIETAMYAPQWALHIEYALGWPLFAEAIWWFHAHTKDNKWQVDVEIREEWMAQIAQRTPLTAAELMDGAVDVEWFNWAYHGLGEERWTQLEKVAKYAANGGGHKRVQLFADAMLGRITQNKLVQAICEKRDKDAARALGLLPLRTTQNREKEILTRYLLIQDFLSGSKRFGPQRQNSEKLAAQIGLGNLARTAGYPDPQRLQWIMEGHAIVDLALGPMSTTVDSITVSLAIDYLGNPHLDVLKRGKPLKVVPTRLKKMPEIKALLERSKEIKQQSQRIVHLYDLYHSGSWSAWQRDCFRRERIQPFKQLFRELYIITPAEREARFKSLRYTDQQVNPRQAIALLVSRGWVGHPDEGIQRTFHEQDLTAHISLEGGDYTPTEIEGLTLDAIYFTSRGEWKTLPLTEVPPRVFSTVMRDVDLAVSVAYQVGVDPGATASTTQMRAALIQATCQMLKLDNVKISAKYVLIEGQLNSYTLHLGSGVVHQQPGG